MVALGVMEIITKGLESGNCTIPKQVNLNLYGSLETKAPELEPKEISISHQSCNALLGHPPQQSLHQLSNNNEVV